MTREITDETSFRARVRRFGRRRLRKLGRCRSCITSTAVLAAVSVVVVYVTAPVSIFHNLAMMGTLVFGGLLVVHATVWITRKTKVQTRM